MLESMMPGRFGSRLSGVVRNALMVVLGEFWLCILLTRILVIVLRRLSASVIMRS